MRDRLGPQPPLDPLAAYASIDSLEGVPALAPVQAGVSPSGRALATVRRLSPGLAIAGLIALAASWLAEHYAAPVMLFALLLPVVLAVSLLFRGEPGAGRKPPPLLPAFLIGFVALVAVNSAGLVPAAAMEQLGAASRWCLVVAISALGAKTALGELLHVGWRPVGLVVAETGVVLAWVLALLLILS